MVFLKSISFGVIILVKYLNLEELPIYSCIIPYYQISQVCTHNVFQKQNRNATFLQYRATHGKELHVGTCCAALRAGGMMLVQGQLTLWHRDRLLMEPWWLIPHAVVLHLIAAASIHPHTHQGRLQQALLGNSFQKVCIEKQTASHSESSLGAAALKCPLHKTCYRRSSSSQSFMFIIIFIVSDVSTFSSFKLVSSAFNWSFLALTNIYFSFVLALYVCLIIRFQCCN